MAEGCGLTQAGGARRLRSTTVSGNDGEALRAGGSAQLTRCPIPANSAFNGEITGMILGRITRASMPDLHWFRRLPCSACVK